jgi:hypothetical protein
MGGSPGATTHLFDDQDVALRDAWVDPVAVFEDARINDFVGRERLVHAVDEFIQAHDRDPRTAPDRLKRPEQLIIRFVGPVP